jgi:hypothetical protein
MRVSFPHLSRADPLPAADASVHAALPPSLPSEPRASVRFLLDPGAALGAPHAVAARLTLPISVYIVFVSPVLSVCGHYNCLERVACGRCCSLLLQPLPPSRAAGHPVTGLRVCVRATGSWCRCPEARQSCSSLSWPPHRPCVASAAPPSLAAPVTPASPVACTCASATTAVLSALHPPWVTRLLPVSAPASACHRVVMVCPITGSDSENVGLHNDPRSLCRAASVSVSLVARMWRTNFGCILLQSQCACTLLPTLVPPHSDMELVLAPFLLYHAVEQKKKL